MHGLIEDIGIVVVVATIIGLITHKLKQPIILGYLIAGVIVGPQIGPQLIIEPENIEVISEIGLILLLFIIGLELDLNSLITSGRRLAVVGAGQFVICVLLGLAVFSVSGFNSSGGGLDMLYVALLCALSSTAIVVKSLNDKFELDTLHGKLSVGILIIQDLWAIVILALQPNFNNFQFSIIGLAILKSVLLVGVGFLVSKYVLKNIFESISKSPEMVVSVSIGWAALVAGVAGLIGLSKEMGALIAGVSISTFPYSIHVTAKTLPLRDFFLTLFFVSLGMEIIAPEISVILASLGLSAFIIFSRFASILPLALKTSASLRTAFISSLNLAQLSEFSLVVASIGLGLGHIQELTFAILIYTMAFTSIISSYLIKYNYQIYHQFEHLLERLRWHSRSAARSEAGEHEVHPIVILGYHRGAQSLVETLSEQYPQVLDKILVVDFNVEALRELQDRQVAGVFGDISHLDTLEHVHLQEAEVIISIIPDALLKGINNLALVKACRALAPNATLIATADLPEQVRELKHAGANEVILPYSMAGEYLANYLGTVIADRLELDEPLFDDTVSA
ncbi:MAG: cation:proton antiporter [Anaerolineales bacterium]|nr:cation:proton antiporter [Anaerolineales bacterium]